MPKDYKKEAVLQKHGNVHKTLCTLMLSWYIVPISVWFKFPFSKNDQILISIQQHPIIIIVTFLMFILFFASTMAYFIFLLIEYEKFLD